MNELPRKPVRYFSLLPQEHGPLLLPVDGDGLAELVERYRGGVVVLEDGADDFRRQGGQPDDARDVADIAADRLRDLLRPPDRAVVDECLPPPPSGNRQKEGVTPLVLVRTAVRDAQPAPRGRLAHLDWYDDLVQSGKQLLPG